MSSTPMSSTDAPTANPTDPGVRCGDADRERTSATLHEAAGAGLLTMDEAEERLGRVYTARYRPELTALTADLPGPEPRPARAGWPAVLTLAAHQLADDGRALLGRGGPAVSGRRRVVLAVLAALTLVVLVGMVALALHGVLDGPEHPGLGHGLRSE